MRLITSLITIGCILSSINSWAYYALHDSGEIQPEGKYNSLINSQFVTTGSVRVNLTGQFDIPLNSESQARLFVGTGDSRFHIGGGYKWIPIPDYENQPALGLSAKAMFAQPTSSSEIVIIVSPIISKNFETPIGINNFYASLPVSIRFHEGNTDYPIQLVGGTFWQPTQYENVKFGMEIGFELDKSFNYLSFVMTVGYDKENGFKFH